MTTYQRRAAVTHRHRSRLHDPRPPATETKCRPGVLQSTTMSTPRAARHVRKRILLWLTTAATATVLAACTTPGPQHGTDTPAPHTAPTTPTVTDGTYTLIQEPQAGYSSVVDTIDNARTSLRLCLYELADPAVEDGLIAAKNRGVDVRVLLDQAFHGKKTNQAAYDKLTAAGVTTKWAPAGRIVHEKAWVADDSTAYVSTANLDSRYYTTSRDAIVQLTGKDDVTAIAATFDADFAQADTGRLAQATAGPHVLWSPAARNVFIHTINGAKTRIDLTTEVLKDHAIAIALSQAVQQHSVTCRIVLNADQQQSPAVLQAQQAGCQVHYVPQTKTGLYLHEKILICDNGDAGAIIGSTNLSTASLLENRELSLHLDNTVAPKLIAAVETQFNTDYANTSPSTQ